MTKSRRGDVERGFSMTLGRAFDASDDGLLLAVVWGPGGAEPVAFCQYVPAPGINGYSLDLMRRDDGEHPNGLLDFAVVETIRHLKAQGKRGLGLNFATMRAVLAGESGEGCRSGSRRGCCGACRTPCRSSRCGGSTPSSIPPGSPATPSTTPPSTPCPRPSPSPGPSRSGSSRSSGVSSSRVDRPTIRSPPRRPRRGTDPRPFRPLSSRSRRRSRPTSDPPNGSVAGPGDRRGSAKGRGGAHPDRRHRPLARLFSCQGTDDGGCPVAEARLGGGLPLSGGGRRAG